MDPASRVSVQGGAGFEQIVNKIKGPALEMLAGAALPGKPMLQDGRARLQVVADGRRIHFWLDPCPLFPDRLSFLRVRGKKLGPRGRTPARESSGICWTWLQGGAGDFAPKGFVVAGVHV